MELAFVLGIYCTVVQQIEGLFYVVAQSVPEYDHGPHAVLHQTANHYTLVASRPQYVPSSGTNQFVQHLTQSHGLDLEITSRPQSVPSCGTNQFVQHLTQSHDLDLEIPSNVQPLPSPNPAPTKSIFAIMGISSAPSLTEPESDAHRVLRAVCHRYNFLERAEHTRKHGKTSATSTAEIGNQCAIHKITDAPSVHHLALCIEALQDNIAVSQSTL